MREYSHLFAAQQHHLELGGLLAHPGGIKMNLDVVLPRSELWHLIGNLVSILANPLDFCHPTSRLLKIDNCAKQRNMAVD
ncbi:hypothetical protein F3Y22_tig00001713pilonHSYRG00078 [Hibiscus syriacus]|uniref:Uncharacterized protein n=1 Tax=Hibiscus syriacus TaxID=106335 RepID=A0A6A3CTG9_HIBSY|nr:hypothetical protein F3Y22_tig00001713pilonHSYRG00078 [Hibiscus syriacus]